MITQVISALSTGVTTAKRAGGESRISSGPASTVMTVMIG
jgi:hypothetical protein